MSGVYFNFVIGIVSQNIESPTNPVRFSLADVQLATLNWVYWFNKKRVHSALGYVSPFEFEAMYYDKINPLGQVA
ncbi:MULTISPECIES: integrase core domain-containing protein [Acinetobacter]|nr:MULTISPECIES: integrase core domain-containing protein [Acinetobacter]